MPVHLQVSKQFVAGKLHPKLGLLGHHRLYSGTSTEYKHAGHSGAIL